MKSLFTVLLWYVTVAVISCNAKTSSEHPIAIADTSSAGLQAFVFPYNLNQPAEKFKLPSELKEVSGIDFYRRSNMVCVQDEAGSIFVYDLNKGELKEAVKFGTKGDYEGVANVNDTIWVLSSNGNLHRIDGFGSKKQQVAEFKTPLDESNDTEGLCFDQKHRRLLIACKDKAGSSIKGARAVYAFDLKTNAISVNPVYTVKLDAIKAYLAKSSSEKLITKEIQSFLDPESGSITFQPSEIHIHPITDQIYIIASAGNLLLVLNRDNTIDFIAPLNPELLKQPEGLTFSHDGTMFISDEGRDGSGNIFKFNYQPNEK